MSPSEKEEGSGLRERLRRRITLEGPISFRDWMQAALYDEQDGYYSRPDLIRQGRKGDYRTAPETSPLFAATFTRYFAGLFVELGSPKEWTIVEAGGGSGEFADGVLNGLRQDYPAIYFASKYAFAEANPVAQAAAATRLSQFNERLMIQSLSEVERSSVGIVFSNELIDALPVHRVISRGGNLRELQVDVNGQEFVWIDADLRPQVAEYCEQIELALTEGQCAEINLEAADFIKHAAALIERGFVITVDYGAERNELLTAPQRFDGTLRGFYRHQLVKDLLSRPGELDLTSTVDWTQIKEAGAQAGLISVRHERLDQFLLNEGLLDILAASTRVLSDADAIRLRIGARQMIMPDGLTAAFQILVQQKSS